MFFTNTLRIFRHTPRIRQVTTMSLERLKENAARTKQMISEVKSELSELDQEYQKVASEQLRQENAQLAAQVEQLKSQLIDLEVKNGVPQIPLPDKNQAVPKPVQAAEAENTPTDGPKEGKGKKDKKPKEAKPAPPPKQEAPVDVGRLDMRVAKIEDVKRHPDADNLYVLQVNCGDEKPRTVCSGLVKHVPMEQLANSIAIFLCNLKPVKMRGVVSEAMIMCANCEQGIEVLRPPEGCQPGELVECEGFVRQPDLPVMNPKKKIFEAIAPDLHTDGQLRACYKNVPWNVPGKGHIFAQTLANVTVK